MRETNTLTERDKTETMAGGGDSGRPRGVVTTGAHAVANLGGVDDGIPPAREHITYSQRKKKERGRT